MERHPDLNPEIINEFRQGDPQAFASFFNLYYPSLCYFGEHLIHDRPAAEDIVKDTFIMLWKKHKDFETQQNIKAFLYITTRNACLNFIRHQKVKNAYRKDQVYLDDSKEEGRVLNEMIRMEVLHQIYSEIEKFPEKRKQIFKMAYLEGMKNEEISIELGVSVNTIKTQKARAILALRTKFTDQQLVMLLIFSYQFAMLH